MIKMCEYKGFVIINDEMSDRVIGFGIYNNEPISFNIGIEKIQKFIYIKMFGKNSHILFMINSIKSMIDNYLNIYKEENDRI